MHDANQSSSLDNHFRLIAREEDSLSLSRASRSRIVETALRSRGPEARNGDVPGLSFRRLPAFATLAAATLVVGVAYLLSPGLVGNSRPGAVEPGSASAASDGRELMISQRGSETVLEWSDGSQDIYTVKSATSAREVRQAQGVKVRGNRYVDRSPSDAAIVYYLVE